jgi:CRISPR-associated protein Cas1
VQHTASEPKQLRIAKHILKGKFNNSLVVLKRAVRKRKDKSHTEALQQFSEAVKRFTHKLARENSPSTILGIEGQVAKQYFALYQSLFADEWQFTQRNRQPPKDPINVLLSLGYSVLFNNIHTLVKLHKINPTLGYLHHGSADQPSLVLDLMEEFRAPIVDATVYKLINRGTLTLHDFEYIQDQCHIKKDGLGVFLRALEDKFNRQLIHPSSQELTDYRRIIDRQISLLKQSITQDSDHYEVFRIR